MCLTYEPLIFFVALSSRHMLSVCAMVFVRFKGASECTVYSGANEKKTVRIKIKGHATNLNCCPNLNNTLKKNKKKQVLEIVQKSFEPWYMVPMYMFIFICLCVCMFGVNK